MSSPAIIYDDPSRYCKMYRPNHPSTFVSISNLALGTSTEDIRLTFQEFGFIGHCFIASDRPTRALVVFTGPSDAA
ncbi:hypothetical protein PGTUg99_033277 [Puccinia graminis f. sp. tritici]|uniref:RRM domain-containing protein n=1 Tax=Puccinia graminis f. sp. tritici TaxID=56615 RepID=A0A5B0RBP2_PUCGR|nr:hypothetical protein PGTUg99_033277 [Puccinia graminis f. sp. tritici]